LGRTDLVLYLIDKNTGQFVGSSGLQRFDWNIRKFVSKDDSGTITDINVFAKAKGYEY
jgi:hypothetical protein